MEDMDLDNLETMLLEFLTFRRNRGQGGHAPAAGGYAPQPSTYRTQQGMSKRTEPTATKQITVPVEESAADSIPFHTPEVVTLADIGMGWPHYKHLLLPAQQEAETYTAGHVPQSQQARKNKARQAANSVCPNKRVQHKNYIIYQLDPIVTEILEKYGPPDSPQAVKHLSDHVIAKAMRLPGVADSVKTREAAPWGRASLLQTVVELMIFYASHSAPS